MDTVDVSFPGLGWTFKVSSIAFKIGSIEIYWYGLIIALGMVLCVALALRHAKENKFSQDLIYDIVLVSLPSALVGARLYYVLCEWDYYSADFKRIFDTRGGGLAVYGGIAGAFLGAFIMLRIKKIPYSTCADYCITYIPLGQAIGRWGNFFNQEAFGTTTDLPWGMTSSKVQSYLAAYCPNLISTKPVHPTFLYESIWDLALFFILLKVRKKSKHSFETLCVYMIGYGIVRFLIEGLRTDSLYIGNTNIRTSQLLSLILVFFGLIYIIIAHYKDYYRVALPEKCFASETKGKVSKANVTAIVSENGKGTEASAEESSDDEKVSEADDAPSDDDAEDGEEDK